MKMLCGAAVMAVALGFASPVMAASKADCAAMWNKADANNIGHVSGKEAAVYMDAMQASGRTTAAADRITVEEFMAACMADVFKNASA
jgi:hydroxyethylthiazole kinase-like sugar kinase family protein